MSYRNSHAFCRAHGVAHHGTTTNDLGFKVCSTCGAGLEEKVFYCTNHASHKGMNTVTGKCEVCGSDLKFTNMKPEILSSNQGQACFVFNDVNNYIQSCNQDGLTEMS
jgi:hypothetical protein